MSHFTILVILPKDASTIDDAVATLLAPFDENTVVEPYKDYLTPEEVAGMAGHYEIDPSNLAALAAKMDDWHGRTGGVDDTGLFSWSTYNPKSTWDWYTIGGRWSGELADGKDIATCRAITKETPTYALVTPDGEWHSQGRMGWFGMSHGDQEEDRWRAEYYECLSGFPDNTCVLVDAHI